MLLKTLSLFPILFIGFCQSYSKSPQPPEAVTVRDPVESPKQEGETGSKTALIGRGFTKVKESLLLQPKLSVAVKT